MNDQARLALECLRDALNHEDYVTRDEVEAALSDPRLSAEAAGTPKCAKFKRAGYPQSKDRLVVHKPGALNICDEWDHDCECGLPFRDPAHAPAAQAEASAGMPRCEICGEESTEPAAWSAGHADDCPRRYPHYCAIHRTGHYGLICPRCIESTGRPDLIQPGIEAETGPSTHCICNENYPADPRCYFHGTHTNIEPAAPAEAQAAGDTQDLAYTLTNRICASLSSPPLSFERDNIEDLLREHLPARPAAPADTQGGNECRPANADTNTRSTEPRTNRPTTDCSREVAGDATPVAPVSSTSPTTSPKAEPQSPPPAPRMPQNPCMNSYIEACPQVHGHDGKCGSPRTLWAEIHALHSEAMALHAEVLRLREKVAEAEDAEKEALADFAEQHARADALEAELAALKQQGSAAEQRAALLFVVETLSGHRYKWEHDGDDESGQHDEDCRACEYEAMLARCEAALSSQPLVSGEQSGEQWTPVSLDGGKTVAHLVDEDGKVGTASEFVNVYIRGKDRCVLRVTKEDGE